MLKCCPYFREERRNKIVCKGIREGFGTHQTFANSKDKQRYVKDYCKGFYASCIVAQKLNECHGEYKTQICPNNDYVDCQDVSKCHRCGWNPEVAGYRLRKGWETKGGQN